MICAIRSDRNGISIHHCGYMLFYSSLRYVCLNTVFAAIVVDVSTCVGIVDEPTLTVRPDYSVNKHQLNTIYYV